MMRRLLAVAFLAVAVPHLVLARPAVVHVFEAAARAEPSGDSAVLEVLAEKAEVSVAEEARDGWRRVRLRDGRVGWIEESALAFPEAAPSSPAASLPAAAAPLAPTPDLRPRIYVKDLSHLAELVKADTTVSKRAEALAVRRNGSIAIWIAGAIATLALVGGAVASDSPDPSDPGFDAALNRDRNMIMGGVFASIAAGLVGAAIHPRREELLDVVNDWNTAHPNQQFEIEHGEMGHR